MIHIYLMAYRYILYTYIILKRKYSTVENYLLRYLLYILKNIITLSRRFVFLSLDIHIFRIRIENL